MNDYFPSINNPGIFSTQEWVDAWVHAWADSEITPAGNQQEAISRRKFYTFQQRKLPGFSINTLIPAGTSTVVAPSLRSEYFMLDNIKAKDFIALALSHNWDQMFIPDIILDSQEYSDLRTAAEQQGLRVLERDFSVSYAVQIQGNDFDRYLKHIGSNTRLKLFNKRKKLYALGEVRRCNLWPDLDGFIEILNSFHIKRWGKPCYQGRNLEQIKHFLRGISHVGGVPDLSVIYCNDEPVSAVLDLYYKARIYNIQSGYVEKFQDGISLGTLHLGLQIEGAFSTDATFYDFMAGNGKNSNYKQKLATANTDFVSVMFVRNRFLKYLYTANDCFQSIRSRLNR